MNLLNGSIHFPTQLRAGYFLNGDVIKYACDDGYEPVSGNDSDYFYACRDGSWNNTRVPLCIKGENSFSFLTNHDIIVIFEKKCTF